MCFVRSQNKKRLFTLRQPQQISFVYTRWSVYCAVGTETLYKTDTFRLQTVKKHANLVQ
jgi:hypothetical protein